MEPSEPIAIIGSSFRLPGDLNTPSSLWQMLCEPKDLLTSIPEDRWSTTGYYHQNSQYHGHTNVKQSYLLSSENRTYRQFDAQFFGVSPTEAKVLDPQVRILLETVYEALEVSGYSIDSLQGSDTSVYAGIMVSDYEKIMSRDEDSLGTYHITGTARSLMSNRISYFFDWHGPSLTIDTACSSSLYAVHYAVQQLRSGASKVAIATGSNLLLDPMGYVGESKLQMLSPSGRSRMWDAGADGYARGEGVSAVVLKTLSAAQRDGDHIECIIRETAVNQDGRTKGITVPSAEAQASLIRECYKRAGLDIRNPKDRPQYFEAHGTGTRTGDPAEAGAISSVFFDLAGPRITDPLFVGSVKTVIGHTEGTAGLAGILKASLALQHSTIPPNLLFEQLNPNIEPFYHNLRVPTVAHKWPAMPNDQPRRASVNSFGFGGANAHAILESYSLPVGDDPTHDGLNFSPIIFSAVSENSLVANIEKFSAFLDIDGRDVNLRDLAYTMYARRTRFALAATFSATSTRQLASKIQQILDHKKQEGDTFKGVRALSRLDGSRPRVLAVFTGQGAQWASMGADIIANSASANSILRRLENRLARLPTQNRPTWSLVEELTRDEASSKIHLAEFSQPLCTAIQILLVDILRVARVHIDSAVGHSSGEIGAAYASGFISAEDAICIAYYRGLHANLALEGGGMMAVGTSYEDMKELLEEPDFAGRIHIAAINSPISVTISGDMDAIKELQLVLEEEQKFFRILKVDRAYHSPHMAPCEDAYLRSLQDLDIKLGEQSGCSWISSVYGNDVENFWETLRGPYWNSNMISPVLFSQAVQRAWDRNDGFDLAIEVGPHPALKAPVLQFVHDKVGCKIPYLSLLRREVTGPESLADGLGSLATHLGNRFVDLESYDLFMSGNSTPSLAPGLPTYAWDHQNEYWHESRHIKAVLGRKDRVNELIGHRCPDSAESDIRWRQILRPKEVPWLRGHCIQDQIVFPAAGYIAAALEACTTLVEKKSTRTIELFDVEMIRPLVFDGTDSSIETVFSVTGIESHDCLLTASFTFNAGTGDSRDELCLYAKGRIRIKLGDHSPAALPPRGQRPANLMKVNAEHFYEALKLLGYQYADSFVALTDLERKLGAATGFISDVESGLLVHPAMLDAAFQSILLVVSAPDDGNFSSMHLPTKVRRILVDPSACDNEISKGKRLAFDSFQPNLGSVSGDVDIVAPDSDHVMIQVEGLECVPLTAATWNDYKVLFSTMTWGPLYPDAKTVTYDGLPTQSQYGLACLLERVAFFYLRQLEEAIPVEHPSRTEGPYTSIFNCASHVRIRGTQRGSPFWILDWENDTPEIIRQICQEHSDIIDVRLLCAMGCRLPEIVVGDVHAVEIGMRDNLLGEFYQKGPGMQEYTTYLARVVKQVTHRTPRIDCIEIGAGTGGATRRILQEAGWSLSSYTFTDISSGFFNAAKPLFENFCSPVVFKTLDINSSPTDQGFGKSSYDLVVASIVLHSTVSLQRTLKNIRRLLKPGGYLVALELVEDMPARYSAVFGSFPGWWIGSDEGRDVSPCVSLAEWDELLRQCGFSGCDTSTPIHDAFTHPMAVFIAQAVDDKVSFLREPLLSPATPCGISHSTIVEDLILVGGYTPEVKKLVVELEVLVEQYCGTIRTAQTLGELNQLSITPTSTVLSLMDLEKPTFQDLDEHKWESLKFLFHNAGKVLWVTRGRRTLEPHANMPVGLLRSARFEIVGLEFQFVDFENLEKVNAHLIAEALLRLSAATVWRQDCEGLPFFTIEEELVFDESGQILIPRLLPKSDMNDRYNSSRLSILKSTNMDEAVVSIVSKKDGSVLREEALGLQGPQKSSTRERITHSLLAPTTILGRGPLFLGLGESYGSTKRSLVLSSKNVSCICADTLFSLPVDVSPGSEVQFFHLVSLYNLAFEALRGLGNGDRLLVHEPYSDLISILDRAAGARDVTVIYTTNREAGPSACVRIHPNAPDRVLQGLALGSTAVFLDLATLEDSLHFTKRLRSILPSSCRYEAVIKTVSDNTPMQLVAHESHVHDRLEAVVAAATEELKSSIAQLSYQTVTPMDVFQDSHVRVPQSIVDWTGCDQVLTTVYPVDSLPIFSDAKTYWLAGLSGSLGLSLCRWMVLRGARYVVISSRAPNINEFWLEQMASIGAIIRVYACDLTSREDVTTVYTDICATLPPIAGVAQGAMVLNDTQLSNMSFDTFQQVTLPKVEGTIHLNQLFQEDILEFFVMFSSLTSVIGRPGQSAYSAANTFMTGVAQQRRRKGLAASVINIGPIFGVGYLAEQGITMVSNKFPMSYMRMSEQDFQALFAEAILISHPRVGSEMEITTGIQRTSLDYEPRPKWITNPIMSHMIINASNVRNPSAGLPPKALLKARLLDAEDKKVAHELIEEALLEMLGSLFQLDLDTMISDNQAIRLDDLGIDSLFALEIRAWLMENLQLNFPVLKLLSGIPIKQLVAEVVIGVRSELIPDVRVAYIPGESVSDESKSGEVYSLDALATSTDSTSSGLGDISNGYLELAKPRREDDSPQTIESGVTLVASTHLSPVQRMFWSTALIFEDKSSLNFAGVCGIQGPLNISRLEKAVESLTQQHESLRTCFYTAGGRVLQGIMKTSALHLEHRQIVDEEEISQTVRQVQAQAYTLERGDTVRLILLSSSPTDHFLVIGATHICIDGLSFRIFMVDLFRHYSGAPAGRETVQYRSFAQRQIQNLESGKLENRFQFWKSQYPDFPPPLPILRVSNSTLRPTLALFKSERIHSEISVATKQRVNLICRQLRITPFHFYLACFRVLLSRFTDVPDMSIGIADAGRDDQDTMGIIGVFANVVPLRFRSTSSEVFKSLLQETRLAALSALENSGIPYQSLVDILNPPRSSTYTPICQSFLNYRAGQRVGGVVGDLEFKVLQMEVSNTGYDLSLDIIDDPDRECLLALDVSTGIYTRPEAETLIKSYVRLVQAFAAEPESKVTEAPLYEPDDVARALNFGQGLSHTLRWPETVIHRIESVVQETPEAVAVKDGLGKAATYLELFKLVDTIATKLVASKAISGSMVCILQEPTIQWVASLLAVMKIGAVYIPLDLSMSWPQLKSIMEDCDPYLVLVDQVTTHQLRRISGSEVLSINVSELQLGQERVETRATCQSHSMILYTSGSTSVPKGVILRHEGLRSLIEPAGKLYGLDARTTTLQQSACVFDMSYAQIFMALCFGGTVCLLERSLRGDAHAITEVISREGVTFTNATPTEYASWLRYGQIDLLRSSNWRVAICGGETVTHSMLMQFRGLDKADLRCFNAYGPTEITWTATTAELLYKSDATYIDSVSVGFPWPNYAVYVVDEDLNSLPPGVQGEIYVGGPGVAAGYVSAPSAEQFVPDVFASEEYNAKGWTTMHRTGDLGRWRDDGSLLLEGRRSGDTLVKLRGIRMDLRDIEVALVSTAVGSIAEAVVSLRRSSLDAPEFLVAHVAFSPEVHEHDQPRILRFLHTHLPLPRYMLPAVIIPLQDVPHTITAKLNRKAIGLLPLPNMTIQEDQGEHRNFTETESRLKNVWIEILVQQAKNFQPIAPETDFFHIGGTSLLLIRLQADIRASFGIHLPVIKLLESSTLEAMSCLIENHGTGLRPIYWEEETALSPTMLEAVGDLVTSSGETGVVVLSGATGLLGHALLDALIADERVKEVYCIGVRDVASRADMLILPKVRLHEGDLRAPRLGLSETDARRIFSAAGSIIHSGAEISHIQSYRSLKAANLHATRELVEMSIPRRIPLHFISTAEVGTLYTESTGEPEFAEVSVSTSPPPTDGSDGYLATKWASERFLERVDHDLGGWPIYIHRPTLISRAVDSHGQDIVQEIRRYATRMRAVPIAPNYHGYLNSVRQETVVLGILTALWENGEEARLGVRFRHHVGEENFSFDDPKGSLNGLVGGADVDELPVLEWGQRAAELGLDAGVVKWVESAAMGRERVFPKVIRSLGGRD